MLLDTVTMQNNVNIHSVWFSTLLYNFLQYQTWAHMAKLWPMVIFCLNVMQISITMCWLINEWNWHSWHRYNYPHTLSSQDNESRSTDKSESSSSETSIHSADKLEDVQQKSDVTITQTVLQKWLVVQLGMNLCNILLTNLTNNTVKSHNSGKCRLFW